MSDDLHSIRHEPHFQPSTRPPSQDANRDEAERLRDSVASESYLGGRAQSHRLAWMLRQRGQNSLLGDGLTHLAAAFLGGLFAVTGAFLVNLILPENSGWGWLNTLVFGPVCEELLKASGAIYLLEKCPYRLHSGPALAAVVIASAFIFAVCENLLYVHVYVDVARLKHPMDYLLFRWTAPTALHLVCSAIASLGLMRIWHRDIRTGHTADLDTAYPFFATAMVLHGGYNLLAILGDSFLFPKA